MRINKWLYFAWVVALIATLGSLFLSEVLGYIPCKLCWFQRIFMYPLSVVLGIACFRNDSHIAYYAMPLTVIGGCLSIIHYSEQKFGLVTKLCHTGIPCSGHYINWFGFITIPSLALLAFILILLFLWKSLKVRV